MIRRIVIVLALAGLLVLNGYGLVNAVPTGAPWLVTASAAAYCVVALLLLQRLTDTLIAGRRPAPKRTPQGVDRG